MLSKKWVVLAVMLTMVLGIAVPAVAQVGSAPQKTTTVFVPPQTLDAGGHQYRVPPPGGTLACSGAPYTAPSGTCTPLGDGMPDPGLVCDIPARVLTFGILPLSAFECHTASTSPTQFDLHDITSPDASPTQDVTPAPNITLTGPKVTRS
jgi:hypothetical protein